MEAINVTRQWNMGKQESIQVHMFLRHNFREKIGSGYQGVLAKPRLTKLLNKGAWTELVLVGYKLSEHVANTIWSPLKNLKQCAVVRFHQGNENTSKTEDLLKVIAFLLFSFHRIQLLLFFLQYIKAHSIV